MAKEVLLEELNPAQREAILYSKGPLLVLAGAGSGKTRVISHRFAHLVKRKRCAPTEILTVTFTNKAAEEMRERIARLSEVNLRNAWIGTFHSQCTRILRKEIKTLDYKPDFSIYDDDDHCALIRHILKEMNIYEALYKGVASRISILKSSLISPEEFLSHGDGFGFDEKLGRVYLRYQDELKQSNALDFDDLIMRTVRLFQEHPKLLERYCNLFSHILVDEFQDTNRAQYRLLTLLASQCRNICVVGDDDQSIYRFRGAEVGNIDSFEKDFPGLRVITLEQNYRSTQNILTVSGAVVSGNIQRKPKTLWTDRGCGEKVSFCRLSTEEDEARHVARSIKDLYLKCNYDYSDFAVLYRVNIHARAIEDALQAEGIPYRVMGGLSFYHRREIKDTIAYMRLICNHHDNVSLRRVINSPPRGIGASTIMKIESEAKKNSLSLFAAIKLILKSNGVASALKDKLGEFVKLIEGCTRASYASAADLIRDVVKKTHFLECLDDDRIQHVIELISAAENIPVKDFIDRVSLASTAEDAPRGACVSLLTLHGAKGLEFAVVFIIGLEEGVLPYFKAMDNVAEIQEERRLFYVGMTRAKDMLHLTCATKRRLYSKVQDQEPSRFLEAIPQNCCTWVEKVIERSVPAADSHQILARRPAALFMVGTRVKHPAWGVGVVRDCCGEGDETKVTVNFSTVGLKRLAAKFANLERL